jgi:hypothetical protein
LGGGGRVEKKCFVFSFAIMFAKSIFAFSQKLLANIYERPKNIMITGHGLSQILLLFFVKTKRVEIRTCAKVEKGIFI